jgi:hypothetical protein
MLDMPTDALQKILFSLTEKWFNNGTWVLIWFINIQQRFSCLILFNSLKIYIQHWKEAHWGYCKLSSGWVPSLAAYEYGTDSVLKRWHIIFRHQGITQKKAYKIQNMAEVWNQEHWG